MSKFILLLGGLLFTFSMFGQEKRAYTVFTGNGKKVNFSTVEKAAKKRKFVFFGELHNDAIAHWLQVELLQALYLKHQDKLIVGSEMYERHQQSFVDLYLAGNINQKQLEDTTKLWSNFKTDYLPMLNYAKQHQIPWIATNVTRKYASLIYKKGRTALDSLSSEEKKLIAPTDFPVDLTLSQYAKLLKEFTHAGPNFVYAQAVKDATMGESIVKAMKPDKIFYHLNGAYHTDYYQGIMWYVNHYGNYTFSDMLSISIVNQDDISKLEKEYLKKADFIICVPNSMTKTH